MGKLISIHALREEGDICTASEWSRYIISIHALREEGDASVWMSRFGKTRFLSTPSARRATCSWAFRRAQSQNFYPRPPRGGRRQGPRPPSTGPEYFYPRPPRGGRRQGSLSQSVPHRFLSTPSARRATAEYSVDGAKRYHFYPRPPRGGRQGRFIPILNPIKFLSTPSARRATPHGRLLSVSGNISIHALREEGDMPSSLARIKSDYFYPRPPRGGRQKQTAKIALPLYFYPRPPRGGRHRHASRCSVHKVISIHALREEGDSYLGSPYEGRIHFYPRPPRGGRPPAQ